MPNKEIVGDLMKSFRAVRNQSSETTAPPPRKRSSKSSSAPSSLTYKKSPQELFMTKYYDLENNIDSFGTSDILYFFVQKASENGVKYVIANFAKDMTCAKKLLSNYSPREVCLMIEFLFESGQTYLDVHNLNLGVISSRWCNKIYQDSMLWVDDEYVETPKRNSSKSSRPKREWERSNSNSVKVGKWE